MTAVHSEESTSVSNPIDLVEELVMANDWAFDRFDQDELAVDVTGRWCRYRLHFLWREDLGAMYFSCAMDTAVSADRKPELYELLARVNEKLWLGHFEIPSDEKNPVFRQTCLMRGTWSLSMDEIADLVDIALVESDRFYPAFQYANGGGKDASEALDLSMVDIAGEA